MSAPQIWGPGEALLFAAILVAIVIHYGRKYADDNPEVKQEAKSAASGLAIGLIRKFFKK
jgi:hypothetical protein